MRPFFGKRKLFCCFGFDGFLGASGAGACQSPHRCIPVGWNGAHTVARSDMWASPSGLCECRDMPRLGQFPVCAIHGIRCAPFSPPPRS